MRNMKFFLLICLLMISVSGTAQQVTSFIRAELGTGVSSDFFESTMFKAEWGKSFRGLEAGLSLTCYNSLPIKSTYRYMLYEVSGENQLMSHSETRNISGKRNISIMLNLSYDLLSFISKANRHHLRPTVGIGWANCLTLNNQVNKERVQLIYDTTSGLDLSFGARYEYDLNKKLTLGAYYEYLNILERGSIGISIRRAFL